MGSNQREKSSISSLKTFMHSHASGIFSGRLGAESMQLVIKRKEGGREGGRAAWNWDSKFAVERKPSAKGSPAPEWSQEDNADSPQRCWRSEVCFWGRALVSFFVGGNNKKHHPRVPAGECGHLMVVVSCEALLRSKQSWGFNLTAQLQALSGSVLLLKLLNIHLFLQATQVQREAIAMRSRFR